MSENNGIEPGQEPVPSQEAEKLTQCNEALEKARSDLLYLRAEFDTYKRNAIKENFDLRKYGAERFIQDLLGVMDNFERALESQVTPDQLNHFVKGVEMTAKELKAVLTKHGVAEMSCLGKPFDPQTQEALGQEPSEEIPAGHVSKVLRKPFKMHDKVIRTGQVIVATTPPE